MDIGKFIVDNVNKPLVYAFLILSVYAITFITLRFGFVFGLAVSFAPLVILYLILIINNPYWGFFAIFILNYYVSGLSRYIKAISPGILMDVLLVVTIISLIFQVFKSDTKYHWERANNSLVVLAFIWFLYCVLELLNPGSSPIGWVTSVRGIGVYFLVIVVITSIIMKRYRDFKILLITWAILSLTAVLKALIQKYFGFDAWESRWLYLEGGMATHIIYSGVRYFSFYTDAANFGTGIAFSGIVFAITSLYIKGLRLKIFFFLTFLACMYAMLISGTRGSIAVPFVGFTLFAFLSRRTRLMIFSSVMVITAYLLLNFTSYGNGISYIRRLRSAFNIEDASFQIRIENQKKLKVYLADKPIGAGIGMSRGSAKTYRPDPYLAQIPNDSWYVMIWVETGIIGLILHIFILLYIVLYGAYIVYFRLKDNELRGLVTALICGLSGVYVASYSLEIMGQFPTGFILYISMTLIFISPKFDEEIEEMKKINDKKYGITA